MVKEIISRYGGIGRLHSDQGAEFESTLYQETCRMWDIDKTRSCPYSPWSNGLVERINATVRTIIKHYVESSHHTWDRYLHTVRMAYNMTPHATTNVTPYKLFFSRCSDPILPLDLVYGTITPKEKARCSLQYIEEQREKSERIFDLVRKVTKTSVEGQKAEHN